MLGKYIFPLYELKDAETASEGERKSFGIFLRKQQRARATLQLLCKKRLVIRDAVESLATPKDAVYYHSYNVAMIAHSARTIEYGE